MTKFIVVTGTSKGIGWAAADALVDYGWSVIGVARSLPGHFPGEFIETDLADRAKTQSLAKDLVAHGRVLGIVNNVGLARHETFGDVDPEVFATVMDLNVRPALQLTQALLPGMRSGPKQARQLDPGHTCDRRRENLHANGRPRLRLRTLKWPRKSVNTRLEMALRESRERYPTLTATST